MLRPNAADAITQLEAERSALIAALIMRTDEWLLANERLRQIEQLHQATSSTALPLWIHARVIDRHRGRLVGQRLLVDRGTEDGVIAGMAAVTGHALVGKVIEVHARTALVAMLDDPRCRFHAEVLIPTTAQDTQAGSSQSLLPTSLVRRVAGASSGSAEGILLRLIPVEEAPPVGSLVLSAGGGGGRILPGLVLGHVRTVDVSPERHEAYVIIDPATNLEQVTSVALLLPTVIAPVTER
jgi:cell shape-determining protein MreC